MDFTVPKVAVALRACRTGPRGSYPSSRTSSGVPSGSCAAICGCASNTERDLSAPLRDACGGPPRQRSAGGGPRRGQPLSHLRNGDMTLEPKRDCLSSSCCQPSKRRPCPSLDIETNRRRSRIGLQGRRNRLRSALATLIAAVARAQTGPQSWGSAPDAAASVGAPRFACELARNAERCRPTDDLDLQRGGFGLLIPIAAL